MAATGGGWSSPGAMTAARLLAGGVFVVAGVGTLLKREGAAATLVGDLLLVGVSVWLVRHPLSWASLDGWLEAKGW